VLRDDYLLFSFARTEEVSVDMKAKLWMDVTICDRLPLGPFLCALSHLLKLYFKNLAKVHHEFQIPNYVSCDELLRNCDFRIIMVEYVPTFTNILGSKHTNKFRKNFL